MPIPARLARMRTRTHQDVSLLLPRAAPVAEVSGVSINVVWTIVMNAHEKAARPQKFVVASKGTFSASPAVHDFGYID